MPRQGRIQSGTGVYHVMMRVIDHQRIFEDSEDRYTFLQCLRSAQEQYTPCGDRLPSTCHYNTVGCILGFAAAMVLKKRFASECNILIRYKGTYMNSS